MRWLGWLVIAALAGFTGGCSDDKYSPFTFKDFPGYAPPGSKFPSDPRHTPAGYVPSG